MLGIFAYIALIVNSVNGFAGNNSNPLNLQKYICETSPRDINIEMVKQAISQGANVNEVGSIRSAYNGYTPAHCISRWPRNGLRLDVLELLVANGANINARSSIGAGHTPLTEVLRNGYYELDVFKTFARLGADLKLDFTWNWGGFPPTNVLELVCGEYFSDENERFQIVKLLADAGYATDRSERGTESDYSEPSALARCAKNGSYDAVMYLLRAGANINSKWNSQFRTPLYSAIESKHIKTFELLLANSDLNVKDIEGDTPLTFALSNGSTSTFEWDLYVIRSLLKAGSDINEGDGSPLVKASKYFPSLILEFLSMGADPKIAKSALLEAVSNSDVSEEILKKIISAGADVNFQDGSGYSGLMSYGAQSNPNKTYRVLLHSGANLKLRNKEGKTAFELAVERGFHEVAEEFRNFSGKIIIPKF